MAIKYSLRMPSRRGKNNYGQARLDWIKKVEIFKESLELGCRYVEYCRTVGIAGKRAVDARFLLGPGFAVHSTETGYVILERIVPDEFEPITIPSYQSTELIQKYCIDIMEGLDAERIRKCTEELDADQS